MINRLRVAWEGFRAAITGIVADDRPSASDGPAFAGPCSGCGGYLVVDKCPGPLAWDGLCSKCKPAAKEFDVRQIDVLPVGTRIRLTKKRGEATIGSHTFRGDRAICHEIKQDGFWDTIDSREVAEVLSRPDVEMTLTIRTPKGS